MGFTVQDLLSGDIVKPRVAPQDNSSAGLGQMLSFLMNSNQQPVAQVAKPEMPSLSELAAISAGRRKEKQQADATEQMRQLIGVPEIIERNSADPLSNQNIVTQRGTGVSGGRVSMNDALLQMMAHPDSGIAQQALSTYSNLNQPRAANREGVPSGFYANADGSITPMAVTGGAPGISNVMDYNIALAVGKAQVPGYGEPEKLQIAKETNDRSIKSADLDERRFKESQLKDIPPAHRVAYNDNQSFIDNIDKAIKEATDHPDAFGLMNLLPEKATQYIDEKGVGSRALVANLGAIKRHDMSGAAITNAEQPYLAPFIPSTSDRSPAIIEKLNKMKNVINSEQSNIVNMYSNPSFRNQPWAEKSQQSYQPAPSNNPDDYPDYQSYKNRKKQP